MSGLQRKPGGSEVALPITPMLDMTFQLLFFFIATYHPPTGMEGQLALALPSAEGGIVPPSPPKDGAERPADLRSTVTINVQTQPVGVDADSISALSVEERSGVTAIPYSKDLNELQSKLEEIARNGPNQAVQVRGDSRLKWRGLVKVIDACRKAGFEDVGFAQPPDFANSR